MRLRLAPGVGASEKNVEDEQAASGRRLSQLRVARPSADRPQPPFACSHLRSRNATVTCRSPAKARRAVGSPSRELELPTRRCLSDLRRTCGSILRGPATHPLTATCKSSSWGPPSRQTLPTGVDRHPAACHAFTRISRFPHAPTARNTPLMMKAVPLALQLCPYPCATRDRSDDKPHGAVRCCEALNPEPLLGVYACLSHHQEVSTEPQICYTAPALPKRSALVPCAWIGSFRR